MSAKVIRGVRKLERPRPLKINSDPMLKSPNSPTVTENLLFKKPLADVMNDLENLHISISNDSYSCNTVDDIAKMSDILKVNGLELDGTFREQIDRYFVTLRNVSREDHLEAVSRLRLLELIELRAMGWRSNENFCDYYRKKIMELEALEKNIPPPIPPPTMPLLPVQPPVMPPTSPALEPGELLRSSGKFVRPTKIAGKNYFKDEIVIRNSDSGKVMGIKGRRVHMIEELSDTIISFQRVNAGARDRLVQITGPSDIAISRAKLLVEDTIRRNASPIREKTDTFDLENDVNENMSYGNIYEGLETSNSSFRNQLTHSLSMTDASLGEYTFSVDIGRDVVKVTGENANLVKVSKLVLEQYFAGQAEMEERYPHNVHAISPPIHSAGDYAALRANLNISSMKSDIQIPPSYKEMEEKSSVSSACSEDEPLKDLSIKNEVNSSYLQQASEDISWSTFGTEQKHNSLCNNQVNCKENGNIKYDREQLLSYAKSLFSQRKPSDISQIGMMCPLIAREPSKPFDPEEYIEIWESQNLLEIEDEPEVEKKL